MHKLQYIYIDTYYYSSRDDRNDRLDGSTGQCVIASACAPYARSVNMGSAPGTTKRCMIARVVGHEERRDISTLGKRARQPVIAGSRYLRGSLRLLNSRAEQSETLRE